MRSFVVALLTIFVVSSPNAAPVCALDEGLNFSSQACKVEMVQNEKGVQVATVNCSLGQTCSDGQTCCRLGVSVSCCDAKTELCNQSGMCVRRPGK